jgi:membrane-associated phospholipid phosphatase
LNLIKENRYFFWCCLLFFAGGIPILLIYPKGEVLLFFNRNQTAFLDVFFKYFTHFGDGIFVGAVVLIATIFKWKNGLILGGTSLIVGLTTQFLKRIVFDIDRPKLFFQDIHLNVVEGVKLNSHFSFPSGHAAAAFAVFCLMAFLTKSNAMKIFCFAMALIVGFSRIYLAQHFFIDVYFGALIAVVISIGCYQRFSGKKLH